MKPWKAERLKTTGEALDFLQSRATVLQSLCRVALDVTMETGGGMETDRDLLNRAGDLMRIAEDEIDHLFTEIEAAQEVEARQRTAPPEKRIA